MAVAIVYLTTLAALVAGLASSPNHTLKGPLFGAALLAHFGSGVALAVGAA